MTVTFQALWALCALGSVTLAAAPGATPWPGLVAVGAGLAAGAFWYGPDRLPDAAWVGALVAVTSAVRLLRPASTLVGAIVAGILSAVGMSLLRLGGLPWLAALAVSAVPPLLSTYLTPARPRFAPTVVREEALLLALTLGLLVAAVPGVLDGWHSALTLNVQDGTAGGLNLPMWTLGLTGGSVALGGLYSLWRRG